MDQAGRNGLRADVHEAPLLEHIVVQVDAPGVERVEQILRPRHEQPDDRAMLLGDGAENPFRLHAAQEHGLAAREQAAEPMHLRARVIQRRDAEKDVLMRLAVVVLLDQTGMIERAVVMQMAFGKPVVPLEK